MLYLGKIFKKGEESEFAAGKKENRDNIYCVKVFIVGISPSFIKGGG